MEVHDMPWYYKDGDRQVGPVTKAQLQQLLKAGKIHADTLLRGADSDQWRPLAAWVKSRSKSKITPSAAAPRKTAEPLKPSGPPSPPPADPTPTQSPAEPETPAQAEKLPFQFNGSGGEYFKVWIVNILLSALTLGIYSAWAKVRRKQYFYGNTAVNGTAFQYLADPVKILKGRLIVFGGFVAYSALNQFYPLFGLIFFVAFLPLVPWFVVRSLAFNARSSALRSIRFNFHGTYGEALKVFVLLPLLVPLTLGIISPYLFYRQKKFVVENSAYGTSRFDFVATARDYYNIVFGLLIPLLICIVVAVAVGIFFAPAVAVIMVTFYLYAMAYFTVQASNLLYNSSRLVAHGFKADMLVKDYVGILVTNTLATVLTLGLFHPFAQVRAYRYKISRLAFLSGGGLDRFVAAEQAQISALGDEMSDFLDFDIGL
jgi:uncharacterized membrane protein YjgN (DUF898 family)